MKTEVFELHHHALAAWCRYRRGSSGAAALLTLDHHTDNLPAFGRAAADETERRKWIGEFDFRSDASIEIALARLRHDEHIDLALHAGVISRSVIFAHALPEENPENAICTLAPGTWPPLQTLLNDAACFRRCADTVLEDDCLAPLLERAGFMPEENSGFILDLDFDGFLTRRSLMPEKRSCLKRLLCCAGLVTISLERDWHRLLRLDCNWESADQLAAWEKLSAELR